MISAAFRIGGEQRVTPPPPPADETAPIRSGPDRTNRTKGGRLLEIAWGEFAPLYPRLWLGQALASALPRFRFNYTRTAILRACGLKIGPHSLVMGALHLTGDGDRALFSVGAGSFISGPLHVDLGAEVRIGDRVQLGHHVTFLTVDHEIGPAEERCGQLETAPITIGDGAWIGSRVTILPGVAVGRGAVVAAGALVIHNVPDNTLVGGVPARVIRQLEPEVPPTSMVQPIR